MNKSKPILGIINESKLNLSNVANFTGMLLWILGIDHEVVSDGDYTEGVFVLPEEMFIQEISLGDIADGTSKFLSDLILRLNEAFHFDCVMFIDMLARLIRTICVFKRSTFTALMYLGEGRIQDILIEIQ